jgi:cell division protein FtsZ
LNAEKTVSSSDERVVFDLVEDDETPEAVVPVAGNEDLMACLSLLRT